MVSFTSVLASATLLAAALAQNIAFTQTPAVVVAGQSYNISWGGGDSESVTLTLRQGNPQNLNTITTIADGLTGTSYTWTVPTTLASGSDYALQITQGQSDINYSGLFSVSNTGASSSAPFPTSTSMNGTMTAAAMTGSAASMGTGTAMNRNTTFSSASLTRSSSATGVSASTTGASSTRTSGAASSSSTSAPSSGAAGLVVGSSITILGAVLAAFL